MAKEEDLILIIFLMMLVTIVPRALPMLIKNNVWPLWVKESLEFLPVSIIASIVIPSIIFNNYGHYFLTAEFITTLITIIIAILTRNLISTVIIALIIFITLNKYLL